MDVESTQGTRESRQRALHGNAGRTLARAGERLHVASPSCTHGGNGGNGGKGGKVKTYLVLVDVPDDGYSGDVFAVIVRAVDVECAEKEIQAHFPDGYVVSLQEYTGEIFLQIGKLTYG